MIKIESFSKIYSSNERCRFKGYTGPSESSIKIFKTGLNFLIGASLQGRRMELGLDAYVKMIGEWKGQMSNIQGLTK